MLPDIGLHADTIKCVFPQESKPGLHCFWVSILNLDKPAEGDPLKILLALLVDEIASWDGPAFDDAWERDGTGDGEVEVIGSTDGEVGEELHIFDAVGSKLQITNWEAIFRLSPEGSHINGLHAAWQSGALTQSSQSLGPNRQ